MIPKNTKTTKEEGKEGKKRSSTVMSPLKKPAKKANKGGGESDSDNSDNEDSCSLILTRVTQLHKLLEDMGERMRRLEEKFEIRLTAVEGAVEDMKVNLIAVKEELNKENEKLRDDLNKCEKRVEKELVKIKGEARKLEAFRAFEIDAQEQAGKKDTVIVLGVKEDENETEESMMETVREIGNLIEVELREEDIKEVRRAGRNKIHGQNRGIVVTLCPQKKRHVMSEKKKLKNMDLSKKSKLMNKVLIFDDLTETRRKLLKAAREADRVDFAYVREGKILAKLKDRQQFAKVENADDLIYLGVSVNYSDFYRNISN